HFEAVGPYASRPSCPTRRSSDLEVFVGFSLFLVLGTAALSQAVGLSMALGAFLAGVMLAESEYRHELELDIEPFKGLLLGLFFMTGRAHVRTPVTSFSRMPSSAR